MQFRNIVRFCSIETSTLCVLTATGNQSYLMFPTSLSNFQIFMKPSKEDEAKIMAVFFLIGLELSINVIPVILPSCP